LKADVSVCEYTGEHAATSTITVNSLAIFIKYIISVLVFVKKLITTKVGVSVMVSVI
jgi:hypothetical protein